MTKTLIAYFSHAGQGWTHGHVGHLEVGNTEVIAKKLQNMIEDSDLFFIDTKKEYPKDHMEKVAVAKKEFEEDTRPELTDSVENMEDYDNIILAFPNWWTTMPMALFTFLESYDLSGKKIAPLITYGGSGFSNSLNDIKRLAPNSEIIRGLAIFGDDVNESDDVLEDWVETIGIK